MLIKNLEKVALLGSEWVLWLLIGLSVISIGIMLERWFYFRRFSCDPDKLGDELLARVRKGDRRGAEDLLRKSTSIEAPVLLASLEWLDGGADAFAEAIEAEFSRKRRELERGLTFLGTLGNNAPFIGLLGTVIGVIEAFHHARLQAVGRTRRHGQRDERHLRGARSRPASASSSLCPRSSPSTSRQEGRRNREQRADDRQAVLAFLKADAKLHRASFDALNESPPPSSKDRCRRRHSRCAPKLEPACLR